MNKCTCMMAYNKYKSYKLINVINKLNNKLYNMPFITAD